VLSNQVSIIALNGFQASGILRLASTTAATNGQLLTWNIHTALAPATFTLSPNSQRITFPQTGYYLVCVLVAAVNTASGNYLALHINGTEECRSIKTERTGYFFSHCFSEALHVTAGQYLEVFYSSTHASVISNQETQKLSIIRIQ